MILAIYSELLSTRLIIDSWLEQQFSKIFKIPLLKKVYCFYHAIVFIAFKIFYRKYMLFQYTV